MPRSRRLRALAMGLVSVCGGAGQDLEQPSDLAVLHCLRVDPFADQLLLAAHVVDEALDGFNRPDQSPERAEQPEAGYVARRVARLVEPSAEQSSKPCMVCEEIDIRPARSPRIAAIGASKTGGRSTASPGSARRKLLTLEF